MIDNDEILTQPITTSAQGTSYSYSADYGAIPTISAANLTLGNITLNNGTNSGYTYTLGAGGSHANAVWTTTGTGTTGTNFNWSAVGANIKPGAKISLQGEDADIDLNGKSMRAWMEKVEERLNILTPNANLEAEWDELRELGERYRELEKQCKEKTEVWKKLKSMPPPQE
jgi:hypothetical protein